ncbi:MAG: hypothetical protein OEQ39_12460 [Gammaproteobacteria bacterium]|nr:hypothetical protein [Gammaproteobacteria bacterium]
MSTVSTFEHSFINEVEATTAEIGGVLTLFRFSHAAGNRSYEIFDDVESFRNRVNDLPAKTLVVVFKTPQLQLRGIVDDDFIERVLARHSDGSEWLIVRTTLITVGSQSWYHDYATASSKELEEELRDDYCWGHPVAVGKEPDELNADECIEAVVPDKHGVVKRGVY